MVHTYPLGYHPFSLITKLIPHSIIKILISFLRSNQKDTTGYKTYYDLGNPKKLEKFFKSKKWKYEIKYYFQAEDYFSFFFPLGLTMHFLNRLLNYFNLTFFASNVIVKIYK